MRSKSTYPLLASLCILALAQGQPLLEYAEWFIDEDPGLGNGVSIDVGANAPALKLSTEINLDAFDPHLAEGLHTLVVRVKDDSDQWSVALSRTFMIFNDPGLSPTPDITELEYFIDEDPKPGNGTKIELNDGQEIVYRDVLQKNVIESLSEGLHRFSFRVLDADGNWSAAESLQFGIKNSETLVNPNMDRVILQWFVGGDPRGEPIELETEPPISMTVKLDEILSTTGFEGLETAVLQISPVDSKTATSPLPNMGIPTFATVDFVWSDIDEDGLPDYWEDRFGFNKNSPDDPSIDSDGDGLTDGEESEIDTNPNDIDTDRDLVSDHSELLLAEFGFDPLVGDLDLRNEFLDDMNDAGLYSEAYIRKQNMDTPLLSVDENTGGIPLYLQLGTSESLDPESWKIVGLDESSLLVVDREVELILPKQDGDTFFRAGLAPVGPDSDYDGIPDEYEQARSHALNYRGVEDAKTDLNGNGKSNLEDYLSGYDPVIPGSTLDTAVNIPHGRVSYSPGTGYSIEAFPDGEVYPIADGSAEGGYRFVDSNGREIMMTAPASLNIGYSLSGQYDFRLSFDGLGETEYEQFHPNDIEGSVPQLSNGGLTPDFPYNDQLPGWNQFSLSSDLELVEAEVPEGSIWAKTSLNSDSPYLLLRQAIEIGEGGALREDQSISLEGIYRSDISVFIRRPGDDLKLIATGPDQFAAQINPFEDFLPGTNYLELYASYAVVRGPEFPNIVENFEQFSVGTGGEDLYPFEYDEYSNTAWVVTDNSLAGVPFSAGRPAEVGSPAINGKILFLPSNENGIFLFNTIRNYNTDIRYEAIVGVPASDDDAFKIWFRSIPRTIDSLSGYFFFISGGGVNSLLNARVGLGYRSFEGDQEILVSDLDDQTLADWNTINGLRDGFAEHWGVKIETDKERIKVWVSDRGEPDSPAGPSEENLLIDVEDPYYVPGITWGAFGLESISQMVWIDEVHAGQFTFQGGLRIDTGDSGINGIQSLDTTYTKPRYFVDGDYVWDRMGSGEKVDNANPSMTSDANSKWIDYVPENPLPVGNREDVIQLNVLR